MLNEGEMSVYHRLQLYNLVMPLRKESHQRPFSTPMDELQICFLWLQRKLLPLCMWIQICYASEPSQHDEFISKKFGYFSYYFKMKF